MGALSLRLGSDASKRPNQLSASRLNFPAILGLHHLKFEELEACVLKTAQSDVERYTIDAARRRIDAEMKKVGLSSKTVIDLVKEFGNKIAPIDPNAICTEIRTDFEIAIASREYSKVLKLYDNKGLLDQAARILGTKGRRALEELIGRAMQNESGKELLSAIRFGLPTITI
jgi:hypothetical protein